MYMLIVDSVASRANVPVCPSSPHVSVRLVGLAEREGRGGGSGIRLKHQLKFQNAESIAAKYIICRCRCLCFSRFEDKCGAVMPLMGHGWYGEKSHENDLVGDFATQISCSSCTTINRAVKTLAAPLNS